MLCCLLLYNAAAAIICRYQKLLAECSPVRLLDLKDMQKQVGGEMLKQGRRLWSAV